MDIETLRRRVHSLMQSNQVESNGFRYTRPAPKTYEQQWLWDSCFHAMIYCHIDPEMAKDELRSLLYHRGIETNGMLPHMIYWSGGGEELWGQKYVSTITQPPIIASAVLKVYRVTADEAFLRDLYDRLRKYYQWLSNERDYDNDYLIGLLHPWESGWDASPRWDALLGLKAPTGEQSLQARVALAKKLKKTGHDLDAIVRNGMFYVEPADYNAIYSANLLALAQIADTLGYSEDASSFQTLSKKVNRAVNAKMWDEQSGFYWDLAGKEETPVKMPTSASFVTLFAGIPSERQAQRLVDQMLAHFSATYPVPTLAVDHPAFAPKQYWRGNTWLNVNWFFVEGLLLYGYQEIAKNIVHQSVALIEKSGFREYFDPLTGEGLGSESHSWSGIVLDMVENSALLGH